MRTLIIFAKWLTGGAIAFAVSVPLAQLVIDSHGIGVSGVVQIVGWPTVLIVLRRMSLNIKKISESTLMYRIEHEIVMEWWQAEHPGQQRPSAALAKAKKAGM